MFSLSLLLVLRKVDAAAGYQHPLKVSNLFLKLASHPIGTVFRMTIVSQLSSARRGSSFVLSVMGPSVPATLEQKGLVSL
ncbi:hypothetical protein COLO4_18643 [Corchorus olitorius]|uniref:Secreted protein n=1 Tax=Corchorus olitorius TaxID=93759 RepID=A0A1R3J8E9_9ROSI|nr:hypothetical protein COLO4_18643 [Corchorus olitorius]